MNEAAAHQLFDELLAINQKITVLEDDGTAVQEVSQLIMRRGQLLEKADTLDYKSFSEETRKSLSDKLAAYTVLEDQISNKFSIMMGAIENQLKHCHENKKILSGYKISGNPKRNNTRDDHA